MSEIHQKEELEEEMDQSTSENIEDTTDQIEQLNVRHYNYLLISSSFAI